MATTDPTKYVNLAKEGEPQTLPTAENMTDFLHQVGEQSAESAKKIADLTQERDDYKKAAKGKAPAEFSTDRPLFLVQDKEAPELAKGILSNAKGFRYVTEAGFKNDHAFRLDTVKRRVIAMAKSVFGTDANPLDESLLPLHNTSNVLRVTVEVIAGE